MARRFRLYAAGDPQLRERDYRHLGGRLGGIRLIRRYGRVVHFDDAKLQRVHGFFARHGAKTVFFGRFIALLRTWAALLAGTAEMPYGVFTLYNVMGGITWAALFGTLGFIFGRSLPLLERYIGQASLALVLLIALIVALVTLLGSLSGSPPRIGQVRHSALHARRVSRPPPDDWICPQSRRLVVICRRERGCGAPRSFDEVRSHPNDVDSCTHHSTGRQDLSPRERGRVSDGNGGNRCFRSFDSARAPEMACTHSVDGGLRRRGCANRHPQEHHTTTKAG